MQIEISNGEIFDKLTILKLKAAKIKDTNKLECINNEITVIEPLVNKILIDYPSANIYFNQLLTINMKLWIIEDLIRDKERLKQFDDDFIQLARNVYIFNDDRSSCKKIINEATNSNLHEIKEYIKYE